jgi:LysM repeat protein
MSNRPRFSKHTVQRGESLWKISVNAYGTGTYWEDILDANHLKKSSPLLVGQKLVMPFAGDHRKVSPAFHAMPPIHNEAAPTFHPAVPSHPTVPMAAKGVERLYSATSSGPFASASPVRFPPFKYDLSKVVVETSTPYAEIKLSFTGEMTIQQEGFIMKGLTFTNKGIELEYKQQTDTAFNELFSKSGAKFDGKKFELSLGIGAAAKIDGQTLATSEVSMVPPATIKYSMKGRKVKGTYKEFEFEGEMGYELEVTPKKQSPRDEPFKIPEGVIHWTKVAAVGVVIAGAVIIVADIVKDIFTAGIGTVESPISFAAAGALFTEGGLLWRGAAMAH